MKRLIRNGSILRVAEFTSVQEKLEVGIYIVRVSEELGFYLEQVEPFSLPKKIYGDYSFLKRWESGIKRAQNNTGILLSGIKGTGKTVTAKKFCNESNKPVLLINSPYSGPAFEAFISQPIFKDSIIFIDEYEKLYNENLDNEDALLSLLDGVFNTKLTFLLTVNNLRAVSDKLKNRLNRIKYFKEYVAYDSVLINGMIDDLLINKDHKESIQLVIQQLGFITPDIVSVLIDEMNANNEPATESVKFLGLHEENIAYEAEVEVGGETFDFGVEWGNPLREVLRFEPSYSDREHFLQTVKEDVKSEIMKVVRNINLAKSGLKYKYIDGEYVITQPKFIFRIRPSRSRNFNSRF